jgi:hypothetical protein
VAVLWQVVDPVDVVPDPAHAAVASVGNAGRVVHWLIDIHRHEKYENVAKN